jgi:hypothetical protein
MRQSSLCYKTAKRGRRAPVLLVTGKAAKLGGGVRGDNFEAARHRQLLNAQMPDRRPVRVSAKESDPQQTIKIYHRWYYNVFDERAEVLPSPQHRGLISKTRESAV